jgi:hypothetical protein
MHMTELEAVIERLKKIDRDLYGQVSIRFRAGRAVLITEERNIKLAEQTTDEDADRHDIHT